jgi:hypothetical protein
MTSETLGYSHRVQPFFVIRSSSHLKPQTDRLQKALIAQNLRLWELVVQMLVLPHTRIQGCPDSLLVKSQILPALSKKHEAAFKISPQDILRVPPQKMNLMKEGRETLTRRC